MTVYANVYSFSNACWLVPSKRNGCRIGSTSVDVLLQCIVHNCASTVKHSVESELNIEQQKLRLLEKSATHRKRRKIVNTEIMRSSPKRDGKCKGGAALEGIPFMLTQKKPITAVAIKPVQIKTQTDTPNPDLYPSTCYMFSNFYLGGRADVSLDPKVKRKKKPNKV